MRGVITKGVGGLYYVTSQETEYKCNAKGKFRKEKITPMIGDYVEIDVYDINGGNASIETIYPRRNQLLRPKVCNIDLAVIFFAAKDPEINYNILDRFILLAEHSNIDIVININKSDLDVSIAENLVSIYKNTGYKIIPTSAVNEQGLDELKKELQNKISVFAGPSGVGKSSIINYFSAQTKMEIGELSQKIKRGKHTTRHIELIRLYGNTFLVDTPGFTSLSIEHIPKEELSGLFKEFLPYKDKCEYVSCSHTKEVSCAVQEQVGVNISSQRYNRYVEFYKQLDNIRKY